MTVRMCNGRTQIRSAILSIAALAAVDAIAPNAASAQYAYQQLAQIPAALGGGGVASTMAIGPNGNLFGVTNGNTIFQYSLTTHAVTSYATLAGNPTIISDAQANIFGVTQAGVFKIAAGTTTPIQLATFDSTYQSPAGRLALDSNGNIYGTTSSGGANHLGSIYEVNGSTHALTTLYSFSGADGQSPTAGVLADSQGNLYGTTAFGGGEFQGTVFKLNISTQQLTKLWDFEGGDGARPTGELVSDSHGNLYGNASVAGSFDGSVFKVLGGSEGNTGAIHEFFADDGANPSGQLVVGPNGEIFGTTPFGGAHGAGTVFELTPSTVKFPPPSPYSYTYTDLHDFSGADGTEPIAGLVMDAAGNIYGATQGGDNGGVIFELAAVPEPASVALLMLGGIPLLRRRSR